MRILYISASALREGASVPVISERISSAADEDLLVVALDEAADPAFIGRLGLDAVPTVDLGLLSSFSLPLALALCGLEQAAATTSRLGAELELLTGSRPAYQCDPAIVPDARELESLSFEEAAELSRFRDAGIDPDIVGPVVRHRLVYR